MDGLQYCRERVLVPGGRLYLTRHFIEPELVPRLIVLNAFCTEIASIPERVSDAGVAQSKLGWWQEEIQRCWRGDGRHPIARAVIEQGLTKLLSAQDLVRLVVAVAAWIDAPPLATMDELLGHCSAMGGLASQLEAQISSKDSSLLETANQLGTAHYLVALIRDIGMDARAGRWYVPMDLEAHYQFNQAHAATGNNAGEFRSLVIALTAIASEMIESVTTGLSLSQMRQIRHLLIQAELDQKLMLKLLANPVNILQQRIRLSAFSSLWTVWRAARKPGFE